MVYFALNGANARSLRNLLRGAIALTFFGHGLYAMGYHPLPDNFIDMTTSCIGINESQARTFLQVAGYLDFVVAIGIFIPKVDRHLLIYAAIWGGLTALARVVANFDPAFPGEWLAAWVHETAYRLPHAAGPLVLWMLIGRRSLA